MLHMMTPSTRHSESADEANTALTASGSPHTWVPKCTFLGVSQPYVDFEILFRLTGT
jgi:hypothetical protein